MLLEFVFHLQINDTRRSPKAIELHAVMSKEEPQALDDPANSCLGKIERSPKYDLHKLTMIDGVTRLCLLVINNVLLLRGSRGPVMCKA